MKTWIAERKLLCSRKGEAPRSALTVRVSHPYLLEKGTVNFDFHEGTAGCAVEIIGFEEAWFEETYGVDSLQALQLASDVEPVLRQLSKKYDFFFLDGEPYFEGDDGGV